METLFSSKSANSADFYFRRSFIGDDFKEQMFIEAIASAMFPVAKNYFTSIARYSEILQTDRRHSQITVTAKSANNKIIYPVTESTEGRSTSSA